MKCAICQNGVTVEGYVTIVLERDQTTFHHRGRNVGVGLGDFIRLNVKPIPYQRSASLLSQYRKSHFVTLCKAKGLRQIISATPCHLDRRERSFEVGWDHKISRFARNDSCSHDFCGIAFFRNTAKVTLSPYAKRKVCGRLFRLHRVISTEGRDLSR
jgi:hypothetical protein